MKTPAHTHFRLPIMLLAIWAAFGIPSATAASSSGFKVDPDYVHIRWAFQGTSLLVSAEIPSGAQAAVELLGPAKDDRLLRKGRRGFLWMSVGQVEVSGAPSLYLLMTTAGKHSSRKASGFLGGYETLESVVKFSGSLPEGGTKNPFDQFVKLKESEGLYGIFPGSLKVSGASGDKDKVSGVLRIPGKIGPGTYKLCLSVMDKGAVIERKCLDLPVAMRGLPAMLASLAHQHGITYGLLAVVIAFVTGFGMGFVFKSKGAH